MMPAGRDVAGMRLSALLGDHALIPPALDRAISGLCGDSRQLQRGQVFFARRGQRVDATAFAAEAAARGAAAMVLEGGGRPGADAAGLLRVPVTDLAACTGAAAHRFFGRPSERIPVVAVTGTNGKTSVSHFVAEALERAWDAPVGLIGTLGAGLGARLADTGLTTPDCLAVHRALAGFVDDGAGAAVMEASSHALAQRRLAGVQVHTAVFTNLSRDHLDYHGDMQRYTAAKSSLFAQPGLRAAAINAADPAARHMRAALSAAVRVVDFSLDAACAATLRAAIEGCDRDGVRLRVHGRGRSLAIRARLLGAVGATNLLASLAVLMALDLDLEQAAALLGDASPVPGRMQPLGGAGAPLVVIDYAHTPAALEAALASLRALCEGRLWCVFGAGGERDAGKRPHMGAAAARLADRVLVTDDNPRGEDGDAIVAAILAGVPAARVGAIWVERDRARAIARAVHAATAEDVVLIAGKGHETYQEIAGTRRPFSDVAAARAALEAGAW